jgi:transcriptional regulator with XRE-family HTH domain
LVKRYRAALGLTQEELAERAGVSARSISDLERDLSRTPYPGTIRRLADAFELTPEQRTAFMVAGVRPRDGDDVPTVLERPGPRAGLGLFRRPVVVGALLFAALVAAACTVLITRGSGGGAPQARVYSTPRVPALLDSWGVNLEKIAAFEPNSVDMAVGPPGYEYAVETNVTPSDGSYNVALRFSPNGQALGVWPVSDQSSGVVGAATDADGNLWITTGAGVRQYSSYGRLLGTWNSQGVNPGQFAGPEGIAIAGNGDVIVGEADTHQVQVFTHEMKPIWQWSGPGGAMQSFQPDVMAVDAQNDVYILDTGNWQIEKYTL